ncbi:hypothetical protein G8V06_09170 [Clostridium botulinum D/C]|uniref:hypothetical protein n=1 Tax=Clostridium botulinum TaxID=1491 RepID=UPI001E445E64|nr:hypothetical protein [Clostridium botulinum]MCD3234263.1 hypothetical protein [Clostridium botulinum D/C]MCD3240321.1 hypothetical protein [Clostridium botulinum D/C]MCD3267682.1 hypothetical protein [Clostridium botulinum D/C]MCD3306153.1 hypothetical protein [Clostridium botulinum D/C]MCD3314863.1 hypothetical protein [Clostridium botulinum D/C]
MKRRIIYKLNKSTNETDILCIQVAEELENIELKFLDMQYELDKDKFDRAKKFHIEDNKVIFDELYDINKDILKEKDKLKKELLDTQEILVNKKYKELVGGNL